MAITSSRWNPSRVAKQLREVVLQGWYLGFTSFGGPPVHFKIVSFEFDAFLMEKSGEGIVRLAIIC